MANVEREFMMEPKLSSDQIIKAAKCFCRKGVRPFKTHAQILEASGRLFELRAQLRKIDDEATYKAALCVEKETMANLHKSI